MAVIGVLDTLFLQRFNQHIKKPGKKAGPFVHCLFTIAKREFPCIWATASKRRLPAVPAYPRGNV